MNAVREEGGQAAVLIAIVALWLLFVARRQAREAADAAAFAGAVVLYRSRSATEARDAATTDATLNGYASSGGVAVTVNSPPLSGALIGNALDVEVIVTDTTAQPKVPALTE